MKKILTAILLLTAISTFAQKEKVDVDFDKKTGIVTINDVPAFKAIGEKSSFAPGMKDWTIQNLEGKPLFILVYSWFQDYHSVSKSNPSGNVSYYEVKFLDNQKSNCEISNNFFKSILALIYRNGLIKDGKLDSEAVDLFVTKNGNKFSELKRSR
jgi:hypothetical protein